MKLIIDLPNKTIAHIRSDYGHKYFGCIGDEDKKIIMKAIYDGTSLSKELEKIIEKIKRLDIEVEIDSTMTRYEVGFSAINQAKEQILQVLDKELSELKEKM